MDSAWAEPIASDDLAELSKLLIQLDPNESNGSTWTPLHYATRNQCTGAVKLLLEANAHVTATSAFDGATALHYAVRNDDWSTSRMLLHAGAPIDLADNSGLTPVGAARWLGFHRLGIRIGTLSNYPWEQDAHFVFPATFRRRTVALVLALMLSDDLTTYGQLLGVMLEGLRCAAVENPETQQPCPPTSSSSANRSGRSRGKSSTLKDSMPPPRAVTGRAERASSDHCSGFLPAIKSSGSSGGSRHSGRGVAASKPDSSSRVFRGR